MFTNIIVAVDGSGQADKALDVAADMALRNKARLSIVHVPQLETALVAVGAMSGLHAAVLAPRADEVRAAGQIVLDRAVDRARAAGVEPEATLLPGGEPADAVVTAAQEQKADLIVSGRRGLGGLASLMMGSTSVRIGQLAKCSCLTVV